MSLIECRVFFHSHNLLLFSSLRIKAYRVYELWLAAGGNCANTEIVDQIVSHTLADAAANKLEDSRVSDI